METVMARQWLGLVLAFGCASPGFAADEAAIARTYADIAAATYADALTSARVLQDRVAALVAAPSAITLAAAQDAWRAARVPYMQTEAFRFGNPIVDDWEGRVNSWPLDEGLIDYVAPGYFGSGENEEATLDVIATKSFTLSGKTVDATEITPTLLRDTLQEAGENEANVATGYHAIEFLLWGQDLISDRPIAGQRPFTDYVRGAGCTGGNCDRRAQYLEVATDLLVSDLSWMAAQWTSTGDARQAVVADPAGLYARMLTGLGNLSYGEMAGQRVKLGLLLHDPEEEHDCFSDDTPESHYHDVLGMRNVWTGHYTRIDGTAVQGPSLRDAVAEKDAGLARTITAQIDATLADADALRQAKAAGLNYDTMLQVGNDAGGALVTALVDGLVTQSRSFERASAALKLSGAVLQADDTLDAPKDAAGTAGEVFK